MSAEWTVERLAKLRSVAEAVGTHRNSYNEFRDSFGQKTVMALLDALEDMTRKEQVSHDLFEAAMEERGDALEDVAAKDAEIERLRDALFDIKFDMRDHVRCYVVACKALGIESDAVAAWEAKQ